MPEMEDGTSVHDAKGAMRTQVGRAARVSWALVSVVLVVSIVVGLASIPATLFWTWSQTWFVTSSWLRFFVRGMAIVPTYFLFACTLIPLSALATRMVGWRTPKDATLHIKDYDWPLCDWARYVIVSQIVRVLAGTFFRGTPVWTWYLRLNGARIGRGVFVNTLSIMDHNLIELGDDTIIGSDVHLSGHTVEKGTVKTATLRIGHRVTLGSHSVIGIGVDIGDDCDVGALSFVPKHARLVAGGAYVGSPVRQLNPSHGR